MRISNILSLQNLSVYFYCVRCQNCLRFWILLKELMSLMFVYVKDNNYHRPLNINSLHKHFPFLKKCYWDWTFYMLRRQHKWFSTEYIWLTMVTVSPLTTRHNSPFINHADFMIFIFRIVQEIRTLYMQLKEAIEG